VAAVISAPLGALVAERLDAVRARIAEVGDPARVRVVAVTKGFGPEVVAAAVAAGCADLGENYAQELEAKAAAAPAGVRWHFLGAPQRNKIGRLAPLVHWWHAVDRPAVAEALAARAPGATVLLQVNVLGDPTKHGCAPGELEALAARCRALGLDLRGLMTVGPAGDPDGTARVFHETAEWGRRLGVEELSMGMTDDFPLAVACGATVVRVGRVLFGPRPGPADVGR